MPPNLNGILQGLMGGPGATGGDARINIRVGGPGGAPAGGMPNLSGLLNQLRMPPPGGAQGALG
jgi:hypothetical protein